MFRKFHVPVWSTKSVAGNARALNNFSFWFCLRFYSATLVVYFAYVTGSMAAAASLLVVIQGAQGLLEIPTGLVSDRLGRVWCVRLQAVASVLSVLCYARGGSYAWLALGAGLDGLWRSLMSGNNEALLYESAQQAGHGEQFPRALANMNLTMEVAGFASVATGGMLAARGFGWALWATVLSSVVALLATRDLQEPVRHTAPVVLSPWGHFREAIGLMRRNSTLRRLSLAQIFTDGFSTFALWPAFYATLLPLWLVGAMYSVNYLESAVGFRASGWFMRRFAPMRIVLGGEVFARVLFYPALLFSSPTTPALMAVAGAPYGPMTVALGKVLHDEYTDHQRATMASVTSVAASALYAVFTLGIGVVADRFGVRVAIATGQLLLSPVLWLYWRQYRARV